MISRRFSDETTITDKNLAIRQHQTGSFRQRTDSKNTMPDNQKEAISQKIKSRILKRVTGAISFSERLTLRVLTAMSSDRQSNFRQRQCGAQSRFFNIATLIRQWFQPKRDSTVSISLNKNPPTTNTTKSRSFIASLFVRKIINARCFSISYDTAPMAAGTFATDIPSIVVFSNLKFFNFSNLEQFV